MRQPPVTCPTDLPERKLRATRGGEEQVELTVALEVTTPILGGATQTRAIDEIDIIRVPTVRGHLRFWWRALNGHRFDSAKALYEAESKLWGGATDDRNETGKRSQVEVRVDVTHCDRDRVDDGDVKPYGHGATPGAYALWPARAERTSGTEPAPRRLPGTRFDLTVICPDSRKDEVRRTVQAWILFGGYGGRTRRGLGSLTVTQGAGEWLPPSGDAGRLREFLTDLLASPGTPLRDLPLLGGAGLRVARSKRDAEQAWLTALGWLNEFRQGTASGARQSGQGKPQPQRPSITNWPEPDKARHLHLKQGRSVWPHTPRHNDVPAWPRAGFGLPILTDRFQTNPRQPKDPRYEEPRGYQLLWRQGQTLHDRLASPLIVKALPLANGEFVPCALWLHRGYPRGEVVLVRNSNVERGSAADFDILEATDDTAKFAPLQGKSGLDRGKRLRTAFFDWLDGQPGVTAVTP